jgi:hypothetical protein
VIHYIANEELLMRIFTTMLVLFGLGACSEDNKHLSSQRAERILHKWNPESRNTLSVSGVEEVPVMGGAEAHLTLKEFKYETGGFGKPLPQVYTGTGSAIFRHYTDGRWVLDSVKLNGGDSPFWYNLSVTDK